MYVYAHILQKIKLQVNYRQTIIFRQIVIIKLRMYIDLVGRNVIRIFDLVQRGFPRPRSIYVYVYLWCCVLAMDASEQFGIGHIGLFPHIFQGRGSRVGPKTKIIIKKNTLKLQKCKNISKGLKNQKVLRYALIRGVANVGGIEPSSRPLLLLLRPLPLPYYYARPLATIHRISHKRSFTHTNSYICSLSSQ